MLEKIKSKVIVAIISAAILGITAGIWKAVSDGALIRLLGGATAQDLAQVSGRTQNLERVINESHEQLSCTNVQIGYSKSHGEDPSDWCPVGMFMTKMDIEGGHNGANYPIVRHVRCCKAVANLSQ